MRVLFIFLNLSDLGFNEGIAFLSSVLKKDGHSTKLFHIHGNSAGSFSKTNIMESVKKYDPGLIAFSVVTNQYRYAKEISSYIKSFSQIPTICGGIHATANPEEVLQTGLFDYVCIGEGEEALLELVEAIEKGRRTDNIPNIWVSKDGKIKKNGIRPLLDLHTLPLRDYDIFDMQSLIDNKDGWARIMTSRGCVYRCSYCYNHFLINLYKENKHKNIYLRNYKLENLITELKYLINTFKNIRIINFDDDIFTINKSFMKEFLKEYKKEIGYPYVCNSHVKHFDKETANILKDSGCQLIRFGLESGSEKIRRQILNRQMKNEDIKKAFNIAHKADLATSAFVMIGLPHETKADIYETISLLREIQPSRFRWFFFFPFNKTQSFHIANDGGFISFSKMHQLDGFEEDSCLDFGEEHNFYLQKLHETFHWHVNKNISSTVSKHYASLIDYVDDIKREDWEMMKDEIKSKDKTLSLMLSEKNIKHYSIKHKSHMAVMHEIGDSL